MAPGGWVVAPGQVVRATALAMAALLAVEATRALRPPTLTLDSGPLDAGTRGRPPGPDVDAP
jgi:hypothetical protein